jgi:hypothetical protein
MENKTLAFEVKIGAAPRSDRNRTLSTVRTHRREISQFGPKSPLVKQALLGLGKDGAWVL